MLLLGLLLRRTSKRCLRFAHESFHGAIQLDSDSNSINIMLTGCPVKMLRVAGRSAATDTTAVAGFCRIRRVRVTHSNPGSSPGQHLQFSTAIAVQAAATRPWRSFAPSSRLRQGRTAPHAQQFSRIRPQLPRLPLPFRAQAGPYLDTQASGDSSPLTTIDVPRRTRGDDFTYNAGSRISQRIASICLSNSGDSVVPQASRSSSS